MRDDDKESRARLEKLIERLSSDPASLKREMDADFEQVQEAVSLIDKPANVDGPMMMAYLLYIACRQGVADGMPPGLVHAVFDMSWQKAEKDRQEIRALGRGPLDAPRARADA